MTSRGKRKAAAKSPGSPAKKAGPSKGLSDDLKKKSKNELIAMLLSAQSDGKPGEEGGELASFCAQAVLTSWDSWRGPMAGSLALS
jgi:hypothetical protein